MQFLERFGRPLVVILALISSVAWRLAASETFAEVSRSFDYVGHWIAVVCSSLTLLAALGTGLPPPTPDRRPWPAVPLLLTGALLTCAMEPTGLWPCETTCANKGAYAVLWGVKLTQLALLPLAALAALAWFDWRRPLGSWARWPIWLVIGGSLYFVGLAYAIELACGHCFQLHTWLLAAALLQLRLPPAWPVKLLLPLVGGLGLHYLYHPEAALADPDGTGRLQQRSTRPMPELEELQARQLRVLFAANAGRQRGRLDAPVIATLVLGLHCEHCAAELPKIRRALQPLLDDGSLRLIYNWAYARANTTSKQLALFAVSAAATGKLDLFHERFLGTGIDASASDLQTRLHGELAVIARQGQPLFPAEVIDPLLESDRQRLQQIAPPISETPVLVLRSGSETIASWTKHLPLDEIAARIRQTAATAKAD